MKTHMQERPQVRGRAVSSDVQHTSFQRLYVDPGQHEHVQKKKQNIVHINSDVQHMGFRRFCVDPGQQEYPYPHTKKTSIHVKI